ncbi:RNA-directed DNA polymerase, eukaryota, reverse transcriptase zinc-binding domain protein [Tanacetum coccineum]
MEYVRCHFFNGGDIKDKKHIWVKWNKALASKDNGGLDVSSFFALNRALLFKWVWRFRSHQSSLWAKVIKGIHGKDGKLDTLFWEDVWRGDVNLKSKFPRIFRLETIKDVTVAQKLSYDILSSSFRRAPRGGLEEFQYLQLSKEMEEVSLIDTEDRWSWSLDGQGVFSVASVRKLIDDKNLPVVSSKTRWIKVVPIKVNILAWKIRFDCLPTRLNLSKRGIDIHSILCPICDKEVESSSHLFFSCQFARMIFSKIACWWDIINSEISSYEEWLVWLLNSRLQSKHKKLLEGVCYVMWWFLWNFRNKTLFGATLPSKALTFDEIVAKSFFWCKYRSKNSFSWVDWIKNPHLITL